MDVIGALKHYIERIVTDPNINGMKALLLDTDTTRIISMVYSQSEILEKEIFLVETLGNAHERMTHLKAAVFVRPTAMNLKLLKNEFKDPKFGEYHLFFSNIVPKDILERLAEADTLEVVRQVQEVYADYLSCNTDLFHLNLPNSIAIRSSSTGDSSSQLSPQQSHTFTRTVEGILSCLLSLKKKPVVRYQGGSSMNKKIAMEVSSRMQRDGLFDFRRPEVAPVLLILDRKDDPVTPLLSQWSYQGMVHELLGLFENRVDLRKAQGIRKDLQEIVLSAASDPFFADHMHSNFGDLGMAIKDLVDTFQKKSKTHENIESIEDMQRFVENYPAFRSQSLNVSKHVALMGELARLVDMQALMSVSQLEQEIACSDDHGSHYKEVLEKIKSGQVRPMNKLRLAIIYALRYESHVSNNTHLMSSIKAALKEAGVPDSKINLIDSMIEYGGLSSRNGDLFGNKGLKKFMKTITQGLQGVPNVYAQHIPPLMRTLESLCKGTLSESSFPILTSGGNPREKPRDVIVFIAGGVTFEEAEKVSEFNHKNTAGQRVLVGGSYLHNSTTFLSELATASTLKHSHSITMNSVWETSAVPSVYEGQSL